MAIRRQALIRAARTWAALACLAASLTACFHRYYTMSPIEGIMQIDVRDVYGDVSGRLTDSARVASIVAFLNARRDRWYDPGPLILDETGGLSLRGRGNWVNISFGRNGMYQTRKGMTYTDSVKTRDFVVVRTENGENDQATLCRLLGPRFQTSCISQANHVRPRPHETLPPECRCDGKHEKRSGVSASPRTGGRPSVSSRS